MLLWISGCGIGGSFSIEPTSLYDGPEEPAVLVIMRANQSFGHQYRIGIALDGKEIGKINAGEFIEIPVSPGKHRLLLSQFSGQESYTFEVEPGKWYYSRARTGSLWLDRLNVETGIHEIKEGGYDRIK